MHPLIARFLDVPQATAALEKSDAGSTLDADEAALVAAAKANPRARTVALKAKGRALPPPEAQQAVIALAAEAATTRLEAHPALGPAIAAARAALSGAGATADDADLLITTALLEEAFGWADDPTDFDEALVADSLASLVPLAALDQDTIDGWLETFARAGPASERPLRLKVAELVLETAWGEGPQNVTAEHLDDALDALSSGVAPSDLPRVAPVATALFDLLREQGVIGPLRYARLAGLLKASSLTSPQMDEAEDDEEA